VCGRFKDRWLLSPAYYPLGELVERQNLTGCLLRFGGVDEVVLEEEFSHAV